MHEATAEKFARVKKLAAGPPELKIDTSKPLKVQVAAQADWLAAWIRWGQESEMGPKELAQLSGKLLDTQKHLADLTGALEVSETQIEKSPKFRRMLKIIFDALGKDRGTIKKVETALAKYIAEGEGNG
jgi:hypothetical protein